MYLALALYGNSRTKFYNDFTFNVSISKKVTSQSLLEISLRSARELPLWLRSLPFSEGTFALADRQSLPGESYFEQRAKLLRGFHGH